MARDGGGREGEREGGKERSTGMNVLSNPDPLTCISVPGTRLMGFGIGVLLSEKMGLGG